MIRGKPNGLPKKLLAHTIEESLNDMSSQSISGRKLSTCDAQLVVHDPYEFNPRSSGRAS